jgi:hypothetical protein
VQFIGASEVSGKLAILTEFIDGGNAGQVVTKSRKRWQCSTNVVAVIVGAAAIGMETQIAYRTRRGKSDSILASKQCHSPRHQDGELDGKNTIHR